MKQESWLWTEQDLLELINLGVQENLELDYKRSDALQKNDAKKNELSKDISAFANSAGGTLVYGVIENGHLPESLDSGFDPLEITKEWLEQVINSRIQRRVEGVRVNQVLLNKTSPGRVAYVVHVPQSKHAPHQAWDKRFYKRFNFESVPMEEYEIRDISNRSSSPDLNLKFAFKPGGDETPLLPSNDGFFEDIQLVARVTNLSQKVAEYAVFHFYVDNRIKLNELAQDIKKHDETESVKIDNNIVLTKLTTLWDSKKGLPLFAGITADIPTPAISLSIPVSDESCFVIGYTIGSPGMATKEGFLLIEIVNNVAKFSYLGNDTNNE